MAMKRRGELDCGEAPLPASQERKGNRRVRVHYIHVLSGKEPLKNAPIKRKKPTREGESAKVYHRKGQGKGESSTILKGAPPDTFTRGKKRERLARGLV